MDKWKEHKEREEAKKYFRQNNDLFLSTEQWIKTIILGLLGAIVLGIVHGAITTQIDISFSLFYIVIGYAVANIVTSVSGVHSKQVGILSGILSFVSFYISELTIMYFLLGSFVDFGTLMIGSFEMMYQSGLMTIIFIVVGVFVSYQQAA